MGLIIIDRVIMFFLGLLIFFLPISTAIIEISACVCIAAWIIKQFIILRSKNKYRLSDRLRSFFRNTQDINKALILFFLASFLSVIFSSNVGISLDAFFSKLSEYILLFVIVRDTVNTRLRFRGLICVVIFSLFFICLDGVFQFISGYDLFRHRPLFIGRVTASYINPNNLGSYLITIMPIPLVLVLADFNKKIKIVLGLVFGVALSILMLTVSKGAVLAFLPAVCFLGLYTKKRFVLSVLAGLFILGLILPLFYSVSLPSWAARIINFSDGGVIDRILLWKAAVRMFMDKPIFGVGLGTFMKNYSNYWIQKTTEISYVHNCYLQTLAETGAVGFCTFILFLFVWLRKTLKVLAGPLKSFFHFSFLGMTVGLIAYLLNSFVDTNFYSLPIAVLFWVTLGLQQSALKFLNEEKSEKDSYR